MPQIMGNNPIRRASHRKLHQMVIAFIGQVGPPRKVNFDPFANRKQRIQQIRSFGSRRNSPLGVSGSRSCHVKVFLNHGNLSQNLPLAA